MTVWKKVEDNENFAVAIHNLARQPGLVDRLQLDVGELVRIERECRHWYYGARVKEPAAHGIFPKSYVVLRHCTVEKSGNDVSVSLAASPIVQEITQTLREWDELWKRLYVTSDERFKFIEVSMRALLELRREILSGTLPQDQLRKVQRTAVYTMDKGNRALGMELTVRHPSGKLVDPFDLSTSQLNSLHDDINSKIEKNMDPSVPVPAAAAATARCYSLLVSVRNFVCRMSEDCELLMALYDASTGAGRPFTESYVLRWAKTGFASDIDHLHNLNVIFTDLGKSDTEREKVYLVCYVVRIGGMEPQSLDSRRSSVSASVTAAGRLLALGGDGARALRRPFGVAAADVTRLLSKHSPAHHAHTAHHAHAAHSAHDDKEQFCVPFFPCEKENLDGLLKKIIANKDLKQETKLDKTGQGLWLSAKLIRGDLKQISEESPHLIVGNLAIARKMGFPEVILPGDARNDLYLTLVGGSFTKGGGKSTDRNIEVTVKLCNKHGQTIKGVISTGGGVPKQDEYYSLVYYHEDRPRWQEVFKICAPIEEFKASHVVFLFRHRSSSEAKDKAERHFALAYTRLLNADGTTLGDTHHNLCVYKIDSKKWPSSEAEAAAVYLSLPSQKSELQPQGSGDREPKLQRAFLALVNKDVFTIETNVCSTKLTQNVELLGVLNWAEQARAGTLRASLRSLLLVPGEELVKFLQDILDALFNILTQVDEDNCEDPYSEGSYGVLVVECLLYVIMLVSDLKYHHFQPVLDLYIRDGFCDTLAHQKLMSIMTYHILNAEGGDVAMRTLFRCMKHLEYLARFVVRSRQLHATLATPLDEKQFRHQLEELLQSMVWMMKSGNDAALTSQGNCIKNLPATVPHIIKVYPATELSKWLGEVFSVLPLSRLTKQRVMSLLELLQGPLFQQPACRNILTPHITSTLKTLIQNHDETNRYGVEMRSKNRSVDKIARVLGASRRKLEEHRGSSEQLELCTRTLSELVSLLYRADIGPVDEDVRTVCGELLHTVVRAVMQTARLHDPDDRDDPLLRQMVSILLDMIRLMDQGSYEEYIRSYGSGGGGGGGEVLTLLTELLAVFRALVQRSVYGAHWPDMVHVQSYVLLNALRFFSTTLVDMFLEPFEKQVWQDWFLVAIAFISQPPLQVEQLRAKVRRRLVSKYGDMRCSAATLIRHMWYNLGQNKKAFVPSLVGPFLEMSLTPETEVRRATIPLLFDMMECEYNARVDAHAHSTQHDEQLSAHEYFKEFENEIINKLDLLVEKGAGDSEWRALFVSLVGSQCQQHERLRDTGATLVAIIGRLMDTLLGYRDSRFTQPYHEMQVVRHILDFYSEIQRPHMYIRYVNKLVELQCACEHWAEAGLSLRLHARLLLWSDAPLEPRLRHPARHPHAATHRHLKEALYLDIIEYLHKGKMWELAIEICKELATQYEDEVFDYQHLANLHAEMAKLYRSIVTEIRPHPEYFRVVYYGGGFPAYLTQRHHGFVYRGKEYERLQEFTARMLCDWPNAEVLAKLEPPGEDIRNSPHQYLQINAVEPIMSDKKRLSGKPVASQILNYYKYNNVDRFMYSRRFSRQEEWPDDGEKEAGAQNEFASLWLERSELEISETLPGVLRWFPVVSSRTFEMSPLEVAIESMQDTNRLLKTLALEHKANPHLPLDPLTRKLSGIVDAAVMGGIENYERAFFTAQYELRHPEHAPQLHQLKDLIAEQIPLLEFGIDVHGALTPPSLAPLHQRIVKCFDEMRTHVYHYYGRKSCELEVPAVTMRRQVTLGLGLDSLGASDPRLSEISVSTAASHDSMVNNRNTNSSLRQAFNFTNSQFNFTGKQQNRNSFGSTGGNQFGTLQSSPARKRDKKERRGRKSELGSLGSSSMWYTGANTVASTVGTVANTVVNTVGTVANTVSTARQPESPHAASPLRELRQELTASRPLRAEAERERERRLSARPASLQSGAGSGSNRNSIGTTDSNQEEEDGPPPPLPQKASRLEHALHKADSNDNFELPTTTATATNDTLLDNYNYAIVSNFADVNSTPVLPRYNYDTVVSPRSSSLYRSLNSRDRAPTPPPKKKRLPLL